MAFEYLGGLDFSKIPEEVDAICEKCGKEFGKIRKGEQAGYCPECAMKHAGDLE